jgi:hypothetical protein
MRIYRVLATVGFIGLIACEDDKPQPVAPTAAEEAPAAASALTPTSGPNLAQQINSQIASVCKAYRKAATKAKKDLVKSPDDEQLKADVAAYDAVIEDACT